MHKSILALVVAAAAAFVLSTDPATAGTITLLNKSTAGGPTWNRPLAGTPPTALSAVGTATAYDVSAFSVGQSGTYTFLSTSTSPPNWDNFSFLYQNAFSAAAPLANVLIGNDDNPTIGLSGFSLALTAGVSYFFVETGFSNTDAGTYNLAITGTGPTDITLMDTTARGPTWNRPLAGNPPTGLSAVGTAFPYDVTAFSVGSGGSYEFQSTAPAFDNFTFLYQNAFSAAAPLTPSSATTTIRPSASRTSRGRWRRARPTSTSKAASPTPIPEPTACGSGTSPRRSSACQNPRRSP